MGKYISKEREEITNKEVNRSLVLQSILYDLDLLPEVVEAVDAPDDVRGFMHGMVAMWSLLRTMRAKGNDILKDET